MLKTPVRIVLASLLPVVSLPAAEPGRPQTTNPQAVATIGEGTYCFAVDRGLRPDRNPPPVLVLQLRLKVTYNNPGPRALIVPVDHDRIVYTSPAPGTMKRYREPLDFFAPNVKPMNRLPPDVSPDNPGDPENDTFAVIPAGGDMRPLEEDFTMPLYRKGTVHPLDLRGKRLYLRLQMTHRELSPDLEATLSDKWTRFGVPWTGMLRTNTLMIDVPKEPAARECQNKVDK